jgi:chaperonin GroEL (HSP60 family)
MSYAKVREATCKMLDMMDEGLLDPRAVADMCLSWMSESSVHEMMLANDLVIDEEDEEDEDCYEQERTSKYR